MRKAPQRGQLIEYSSVRVSPAWSASTRRGGAPSGLRRSGSRSSTSSQGHASDAASASSSSTRPPSITRSAETWTVASGSRGGRAASPKSSGTRKAAPTATSAGCAVARPARSPAEATTNQTTARCSNVTTIHPAPARNRRDGRPHRFGRIDPLHPELRRQREPVRERGDRHRLDVVRRDEVAAEIRGAGAGQLHERERAPRRGPDGQLRRLPRRARDRDRVLGDGRGDVYLLDRCLHRPQRLPVADGLELDPLAPSTGAFEEDVALRVLRRIADRDADEETVELRLRQRVRPL